jgi:hypothetical protein
MAGKFQVFLYKSGKRTISLCLSGLTPTGTPSPVSVLMIRVSTSLSVCDKKQLFRLGMRKASWEGNLILLKFPVCVRLKRERIKMMKINGLVSSLVFISAAFAFFGYAGLLLGQQESSQSSRLAVIWSSGDPDVAHKVCFMYTHNAKRQKWFDEIVLVVWGPSAKLLSGDKDLQAKIKAMLNDGVKVQACQACSDSYGVSDQLRDIGVDVKYMGIPLTNMLKQDWKVLTF